MKFVVTYTGVVHVVAPGDADFDTGSVIEEAFDVTMRELVQLRASDPSVTGSIASGVIELSAVFEGVSLTAAMEQADVAFRAALHAAGVCTEGWEEAGPLRVAWRRIEADDAAFETVS